MWWSLTGAFGALVLWGVVWVVSLSADQCGAEDGVECTTLGSTLLAMWIVLPLLAISLLVLPAIQAARHRRKQ